MKLFYNYYWTIVQIHLSMFEKIFGVEYARTIT